MKKSIIVALISVLVLFSVGCEQRPAPIHFENVPTFSYENDLISYSDNSLTVKKDGFANSTELEKAIVWDTEAVEWAAKECPIEWDNTHTYFDSVSAVWKIEFWDTKDTEGYPMYIYQTVYLNSKGMTLLIVYGE